MCKDSSAKFQTTYDYIYIQVALKSTNFSVPQGSELGPLLFLLYVNDTPKVTNYNIRTMYADDISVVIL